MRTPALRQHAAVMVVDESGALTEQPHNPWASQLYPGLIYGDVLILGEAMVSIDSGPPEPDLVGLDQLRVQPDVDWVELVHRLLMTWGRCAGQG